MARNRRKIAYDPSVALFVNTIIAQSVECYTHWLNTNHDEESVRLPDNLRRQRQSQNENFDKQISY